MRVCLTFVNIVTGAVLGEAVSQDAVCRGPQYGVAWFPRSHRRRENRVLKSHRGVGVAGVGQGWGLRSGRLIEQTPGEAQVAPVLVHTAHVSSASIWQGPALVHIYTLPGPSVKCKAFCARLSVCWMETKQNKYQSCQHPCRGVKPEASWSSREHASWFPVKLEEPFSAAPQGFHPFTRQRVVIQLGAGAAAR